MELSKLADPIISEVCLIFIKKTWLIIIDKILKDRKQFDFN